MSKYVESYWAEELPNGVIHLLINCTQREIYYHSFMDNQFLIAGTQEEYDNWTNDVILNTEKFLPEIDKGLYLQTSMKEKDQISFYWIPRYFEDRKKRKILIESNKKYNG